MADSITIRLGLAGGAEADAAIRKIGESAEQSFGKAGVAAESASQKAQSYLERLQNTQRGLTSALSSAQGSFASGQASGLSGIISGIQGAGGLRNFAAASGGPLAAGLIGAGALASETSRYAEMQALAEKANVSAREVEGLQRTFAKLGVETGAANSILSGFSEKLLDAKGKGADLSRALTDAHIAVTNLDGSARPATAVLGDLAGRIKATADEDEKLRLATIAVGAELAGSFVSAIERSNTGLSDLASASNAAGSSFTNDLARGAKAAEQAVGSLKETAMLAYQQLKLLAGVASDLDKVSISKYNLDRAKAGSPQPTYDAMGNVTGQTSGDPDPQKIAAAQSDYQNSILRATMSGQIPRMRPIDASQIGKSMTPPEEDAGGGGRRGASAREEESNYEAVRAALEKLGTQYQLTGKDRFVFDELSKLNSSATDAEKDAIRQKAEAFYDLKTAQDAASASQRQLAQDSTSVAQGLAQAAFSGRNFGDALKNILSNVASRQIGNLVGGIGGGGSSGAGILGSLGSLIGLGGGSNFAGQAAGAMGPFQPSSGGGFLSGLGALFSGMFAEGGSIPAGHWGIAGERGPEPIFGPATVLPFHKMQSGGGNGAVTINQSFSGVMTREEVAATARREAANGASMARAAARSDAQMRSTRFE